MSADQVALEVDRQLSEQRAQADAFATRAGVLIATSSLVTGLLAARMIGSVPNLRVPFVVIAVAAVLGVVVLCLGRLITGPPASQLGRLSAQSAIGTTLVDAKILIIEANTRALLRTEFAFGLQAVATVLGVVLLMSGLVGNR